MANPKKSIREIVLQAATEINKLHGIKVSRIDIKEQLVQKPYTGMSLGLPEAPPEIRTVVIVDGEAV